VPFADLRVGGFAKGVELGLPPRSGCRRTAKGNWWEAPVRFLAPLRGAGRAKPSLPAVAQLRSEAWRRLQPADPLIPRQRLARLTAPHAPAPATRGGSRLQRTEPPPAGSLARPAAHERRANELDGRVAKVTLCASWNSY